MAAAATTAAKMMPNFRVGGKQVFLPSAVVTLIPPRPEIPPNFATFHVPLKFNKLDLRDYLFHCYGVKVLSVRSYIQQQPLRKFKNVDGKAVSIKTTRPMSKKFMMVELAQPFVYPAKPEDLSPWDHDQFTALRDEQESLEKLIQGSRTAGRKRVSPSAAPVSTSRILQAQQAQALLKGGVKWDNEAQLDKKWEEVEVGWDIAPEAKKS